MYRTDNPFFIARETELTLWKTRLIDSAPLVILNVHGHSGVGKTWLLGAFRDLCRQNQVPFAQLDAYRLGDDLSPAALLAQWADQLGLKIKGGANDILSFDRLLPHFITALADNPHPVIALMVDDYDSLFHLVDPWLRHLFRAVRGLDQFTGPPTRRPDVTLQALPRLLTVISSHEPVSQRWPPNPLYHEALETLHLADFSFAETCDYLTRRNIAPRHHRPVFRLTQGHPLMLALVVSLCEESGLPPTMPETTDRVMQHVLAWALRDVKSKTGTSQIRVTEMLRASAVVRRFNQPLLAAMLDQARISDALFDQVTALSMVVERKPRPTQINEPSQNSTSPQTVGQVFGGSRLFALHDVLRAALLEDAQNRGLSTCMDDYRRRALLFHAQRLSDSIDSALGKDALDILFLHRDSVIRDMFFGWSSAPLASDRVTCDEMQAVLEPLMRDNIYYQILGFQGPSLERLIHETAEWLALDHKLHGDLLHFFRVVRRSNTSRRAKHQDIAGYTLTVPVTQDTLSHLRQDTVGAAYETSQAPIVCRQDAKIYYSLRMVADGLDSFSALLRTLFVQMSSQSFEMLVTAIPWTQLSTVLQAIGFDILDRQVEYEGQHYDILQLDVQRQGGAARWLFRLVREELGLPPHSLLQNWNLFKEELQQALEHVHDSFKLLAQNPLIDEFTLVERTADEWARAEALTKVLQDTLETMRLPAEHDRPDAAFHILNKRYGLVGAAWRRVEFGAGKPSVEAVARALDCSKGTFYNRLDEALETFARAFRRRMAEY